MSAVLPSEFSYTNTIPPSFKNRVRTIRFNAQNIYQNIQVNDIIRFMINTNGFWDPYNCYLDIQIATDASTPQQIDTSGHSLIRNMVISCRGNEIERINEYNMLANILTDLKYSERVRGEISYTGMSSFCGTNTRSFTQPFAPAFVSTYNTGSIVNTALPGEADAYGWGQLCRGSDPNLMIQYDPAEKSILCQNLPPECGNVSIMASTNWVGRRYVAGSGTTINVDHAQYALNMESKYITPAWEEYFLRRRNPTSGLIETNEVFQRQGGPLVEFLPDYSATSYEPIMLSDALVSSINQAGVHRNPLTPHEMVNGQPFNPIRHGGGTILNLKLPFLSSYFGHLMPSSEYKFIPMRCFRDLELEFQLDPYAVFSTTAASGIPSISTSNITTNATRNYKILAFSIVVDMVLIDEALEQSILNTAINSGIILNTNSWATGPPFICTQGMVPPTCQINLGFNSLKSILFCFNDNSYTAYPWVRKFYRNSMCLTSLQMKVGTEYIPPQPITGNSGNSITLSGAADVKVTNRNSNADFILNLYKSIGKLWDPDRDNVINPRNFAINDRYWDPSDVRPLFSNYASTYATRLNDNVNTTLAYPHFHENRIVGKAVFGLDLEGIYSPNKQYTSGLNTIENRPFDLIFGQDTGGLVGLSGTQSSTLYLFFFYDAAMRIQGSVDAPTYTVIGRS